MSLAGAIMAAGSVQPFTFNLWQDVAMMLGYDFMRQAFLAGTLLSLVAGLVGYFVVLRHQAFAGEALSDVAFTGAVGGAAFAVNPLVGLFVSTIAAALAMGTLGDRLRGRDVAVGTVLAWVLGLGALFLSLFRTHASGTGTGFSGVSVLFGNILGVSAVQTLSIGIVSGVAIVVLLVIGRPLLFASLDADVATAKGVPV
ncbi:MAG: metal ABC transporter permease, partial [Ktedonobacterales bacterium]